VTQFSSLGLAEPILRALDARGYATATPIQAKAIPLVLMGRDLLAAAQTGTGKTAGFTLPLLQRLSERPGKGVRALVLTPTRELAAQVEESIQAYGTHLPLKSTVVFGGVGINPQIDRLKKGVDIVVATPGRLLDLHGQRAISFENLEILVLDEADRMLDMGFIHDIRRVLKLLPARRQNLLFSATFSDEIRSLAEGLLNNPASVDVAPRNTTAERVDQLVYRVEKGHKPSLLSHLIKAGDWDQVLVFTRTKHGANRLAEKLEKSGITAAAIHGNKSQNARTQALAKFKSGEIRALVATDIAARGLDIAQLPHVVNFELPNVPEDYVHRIGRTGRAGASGQAVSLVSGDENKLLRDIERLLRKPVPVAELPEFERPSVSDDLDARPPREPRQPRRNSGEGRRQGASQGRGNGQSRGAGEARGGGQRRSGGPARAGQPQADGQRRSAGRNRSDAQPRRAQVDLDDDNRGNRAGANQNRLPFENTTPRRSHRGAPRTRSFGVMTSGRSNSR
jgi:ATP-dependent RNA helicase RhlE